jgi:hypothetical protein
MIKMIWLPSGIGVVSALKRRSDSASAGRDHQQAFGESWILRHQHVAHIFGDLQRLKREVRVRISW